MATVFLEPSLALSKPMYGTFRQSSVQSIPHGNFVQLLAFTPVHTVGAAISAWDNINSRFIIPTTGSYLCRVKFASLGSSVGTRAVYIRVNGSDRVGSITQANSPDNITVEVSSHIYLFAGDTVAGVVHQNSGAALSTAVGSLFHSTIEVVQLPSTV